MIIEHIKTTQQKRDLPIGDMKMQLTTHVIRVGEQIVTGNIDRWDVKFPWYLSWKNTRILNVELVQGLNAIAVELNKDYGATGYNDTLIKNY